jgi:type II secretory pathway component PulM
MNIDPRPVISNYWARLAPRERVLLGFLAVTTTAIGIYSLIWEPLQASREMLVRKIEKTEKDLTEIQHNRDEYFDLMRRIEANQAAISKEDPNFNLFSYLQNTVTQAVSRDRITSMNPTTQEVGNDFEKELVEIKLAQINLQQLVDILYRIEKGEHPLRFSRLSIKKRRDDIYNFDVTATVSLLKAAKPKAAGASS